MKIFEFISGILKPVSEIIDNVHTSEEERLKIKESLFSLQTKMTMQVMNYESKLLESKTKIITAEANGQSWMQRNWRPITMLTFLVLVVLDTMGYTEFRLSGEAWTLLQLGLGGYVVGRSAEKIIQQVAQVMKKD